MPRIIIPIGLIRALFTRGSRTQGAGRSSGQAWLDMSDKRIQVTLRLAAEKGGGDPVPELINMLHGEYDDMRISAAQGLAYLISQDAIGQHQSEVVDALVDAMHIGRKLRSTGRFAAGGQEILDDVSSPMRSAAAEGLAQLADPRSVEGLILGLSSYHGGVRRFSAVGLGRIKDPRAIDALATALNDPDNDVRSAVITALKQVGSPDALDVLETWRQKRQHDS